MTRMRLFLLGMLCTVASGAQVVSLSDIYGSLQSPNFPEPYPRETEVRWNISVPEGYRIRLYFSHFDLEPSYLCEYDYVKVEADGEVLALFCGREQTDTEQVPMQGDMITSPRTSLSVLFSSDFSNEERFTGFLAHYSAVDEDECGEKNDEDAVCDHFCHNYIGGYYCSCRYGYLLHSDNRTCRVECSDGVYVERVGAFSSADFPRPYPKSSECVYRIELEEGFNISLTFDDTFDVEDHPDVTCPYDYVKIQTGSTVFGPFCGDRSPGQIHTGSHQVEVAFHSDNSGENLGWRLTYTAQGSQCPVPEAPANGLLNPVQSEYTFRDHILVTCLPGYRLMKDDEYMDNYQLDCQRDGLWSDAVPTCQMVDCGNPKEVAMGEVVFGSHDNSTYFGATVRYICKEVSPLQLHLNSTYICGERGEWTNSDVGTKLPNCLPGCGEPWRALPSVRKRIVGGLSAEAGLFPWQVLLSVEDVSRVPQYRGFGSGALLSERWVLTAAHVLRSMRRDTSVVPLDPQHVQVYLGLHDTRDKRLATNRSVETIVLHPHFQPSNYDNDIAMVKLSEPVELSELIRPVCLPPPQSKEGPPAPFPNSLGLVAGWGISHPNINSSSAAASPSSPADPFLPSDLGLTSDLLQYVRLPVVPQDECQDSYRSRSTSYNITSNMFCAGFYEGGQDTCLGDSGGAFVIQDEVSRRWAVHGLVSWGGPEECGSQRVYGVYTRVANYVEWIQSHLDTDP